MDMPRNVHMNILVVFGKIWLDAIGKLTLMQLSRQRFGVRPLNRRGYWEAIFFFFYQPDMELSVADARCPCSWRESKKIKNKKNKEACHSLSSLNFNA